MRVLDRDDAAVTYRSVSRTLLPPLPLLLLPAPPPDPSTFGSRAVLEPPTDDLRDRILHVALRLFADRGYGPTSMREVAEGAGCTKPALYYHFGSKETLFRAVVEHCLDGLLPLLAQVSAQGGTVRARLQALATAIFEALRQDPHAMRLMLVMQARPEQGQPDIDFARYHERNQALLRELFTEGIRTGEIRPDVPLDDAALALIGTLHSRAFLALRGLPAGPDCPRRIVDLLFNGLSPAPTEPSP